MINASLQYVKEWKAFLEKIAAVVNGYFLLTRVPVVEHADHFVAIQNESDNFMYHQQFKERELVEAVQNSGLRLIREFVVGDRPFVYGAPEQCEMRGYLFKK